MSTQDPQGQQPDPYLSGPAQQQGYQQQGGYPPQGGYAGGMYGGPDPGQQPGRPGVLVGSVVLWVLSGLLLLLIGLSAALFGGAGGFQQQIEDAMQGSATQLDPAALQQGVVITGIVFAVLAVLLIVLALVMLGRQNWARILLTVLGVISLLPLLGTIIGPLLVLVAIVLQFLPPANAWFSSRPRPV